MEQKTAGKNVGFTLIELLVVIGILSILLAITLIAISPARQFAQIHDTTRRNDVRILATAINRYITDHKNALPKGISAGDVTIPISSAAGGTGAAFCNELVPAYIAAFPSDPQGGTFTNCANYATGYTISVSSAGTGQPPRITITAPHTELAGTDISAH